MGEIKTEKQLFEHVWEYRRRVSEISGIPLFPKGHSQWHWQFAHIISKGAEPLGRLDPDNICLMLPDEHYRYDNQSTQGDPDYAAVWARRAELKQKYELYLK